MKILVTGGTGMLGHALQKVLPDAVYVGSQDYHLKDPLMAHNCIAHNGIPDVVIHCAARVGGIKDNSERPYDYFVENARINTNVVDACVFYKVPKLIAISSTCAYPAKPPSFPITEDMLHAGPAEETNFGYAYAKRMMQVQIDAARKQHGFKWSVIYPSNLYGPHDTFDLQRSHVVPALMMKMHKAKADKSPSVQLLGSGNALRQLTYVGDLARFIGTMVESDQSGDFNFAYPINLPILQIAQIVAEIVGFRGVIEYSGELEGVAQKDVAIQRAFDVFGDPKFTIPLQGIAETYQWYLENKA